MQNSTVLEPQSPIQRVSAAFHTTHVEHVAGTTIAVVHQPSALNDAVALTISAGMRDEQPGEQGMMHLLEHMVYQDGSTITAREREHQVHSNGGILGANTHMDYVEFYELASQGSAHQSVNRLLAQVFHPALDPEQIADQIRGVAAERANRLAAAPGQVLPWPHLQALLWSDFTHSHDGTGDLDLAERATPQKLRALHRTHFHADNTTITILTSLDPALTLARTVRAVEDARLPRSLGLNASTSNRSLAQPARADRREEIAGSSRSRVLSATHLGSNVSLPGALLVANALKNVPGVDASAGMFGAADVNGADLFVIVDDSELDVSARARILSVTALPDSLQRAGAHRALFELERKLNDDLGRARVVARDLALGRATNHSDLLAEQVRQLLTDSVTRRTVTETVTDALTSQPFATLHVK